ncbi:MAG: hypothetical protein PHD15_01175 [Clostridia bacterium]|nr:hypothetical protein [Clostridia bacterium]MDD4386361.1 hypothetical protein [Clostridia bacterium]
MHINIRNIVICIISVILFNMSFHIILNISKNEYLKKVIKSDSQQMLKDYIVYSDMNVVLKKYLESVKNSEYKKTNDMSLFYAKKSKSEYDILKSKLQLSDNYTIAIEKVYVLDNKIYKCVFNIKTTNDTVNTYTICLKLDSDIKYFRILDFVI